MDASLVELRAVCVRHGKALALSDVSFTLPRASSVALIGPNGAGKSTLLRVLAGRQRSHSGAVHWRAPLDGTPSARRSHIGYASQGLELDPELTVREHLLLFCALERLGRARTEASCAQAVGAFALERVLERPVRYCSLGMRQRLHVALALLNQPSLLLLDEPASALDPEARAVLTGILSQHARDGNTSVLATHDLEVAGACDHIILLSQGQLLWHGTPAQLSHAHRSLAAAYASLTGKAPGKEARDGVPSAHRRLGRAR